MCLRSMCMLNPPNLKSFDLFIPLPSLLLLFFFSSLLSLPIPSSGFFLTEEETNNGATRDLKIIVNFFI